ncbi:MAG: phenylalanine--tRNA ligase subunit alpha [Candidatus Woesebacteria bacterium]|jgi:phenylalanyl-tRNA synthetase alpha chain
MKEDINNTKNEAIAQIVEVDSQKELDRLRISYLGRNGKITSLIKEIKNLRGDKKREVGRQVNEAKSAIEEAIWEKEQELTEKLVDTSEWFDLTTPGEKPGVGHLHPQTKVLNEIIDIFSYLGYQIADGPEIEKDHYNFTALNFPPHHPARDAQQSIYLESDKKNTKYGFPLLRTHTSAMQGRIMEKSKPPLKVIVPGRCYRYEQVDASHGFEFWQVEGFAVDKNIHLTDLFGTLEFVLKKLFNEEVKIRYACTYFPFVEPGVDTYIECTVCNGKGCSFCKKTGWSEIMPAGMIHPFVLKNSGIDPDKWRGFAFAIGLSRVVTLRYQIDDLRVLTTPDIDILKQF